MRRRGGAGEGGDDEEDVWGTAGGGYEEEDDIDGCAGVSIGSHVGAREGGPTAVGGERVELIECVDGLCATRFRRGGKKQELERKK